MGGEVGKGVFPYIVIIFGIVFFFISVYLATLDEYVGSFISLAVGLILIGIGSDMIRKRL